MMAEAPAMRFATAAAGLVGAQFRLHGRHREHGLDCLGVIAAALREAGLPDDLPLDYALRNKDAGRALDLGARWHFTPASRPVAPGDVLLLRMGAATLHFVLAVAGGGFVHAHAGQRQVLLSPRMPEGEILAHWRLDPSLDPQF